MDAWMGGWMMERSRYELRESDLEVEGRERGMSQVLTRARAKANAWGMEARKRNKERGIGGGRESMDGY